MRPLPGWRAERFAAHGIEHTVYSRSAPGPAVLVLHELPGMSEECLELGGRIHAAGYTVYLPLLFGKPGQTSPVVNSLRVCISREIRLFAERRSSPVVDWLRALGRLALERCGGPGVGVVGMCLTGNFALSLMAEPEVLAPVASQPSLPLALPWAKGKRRELAMAPEELARVRERAEEGQPLLGFRFSEDRICPAERFERLRDEVGDAFRHEEIDSSPGNPHGIGRGAHSVLTLDFVDREGHPTRRALDRLLAFLEERLGPPPPPPE